MKYLKRLFVFAPLGVLLLVVALDIWGFFSQGTVVPDGQATRDTLANRVVMVFGATGSVGDGLLKAAMEDPEVEKVYVVTRSSSTRIAEGVTTGRIDMLRHQDFTDYAALADILGEVNTVLWGLGTSSLNVDDATYTWIHVDFPIAFVSAWLAARQTGPMSFHYVTGMGTDPDGDAHWAREKGRAEQELAAMAAGSDLRTFSYRSAYIRPSSESANTLSYLGEQLLRPGKLVIPARELGWAMLEISARTTELANGTLIDNADSIAYARLYPFQAED